jgi:hypothetical protein
MNNEQIEQLNQISSDVKDLKRCLIGDKFSNDVGLVDIVEIHDKKIGELMEAEKKRKWTRAVLIAVGTGLIALYEILREFKNEIFG